ncbi:MAG: GrdX family protein [Eubacteriales bacterium]|nr:GrdX family protein [Eubacteriales bacterium]
MKKILITNNKDVVAQEYKNCQIQYFEKTLMQMLYHARDMVHCGHVLLSHPLCGSLKPNETPYKSILLSEAKKTSIDHFSLEIMESAIKKAENFPPKPRHITEKNHQDFRLIDKCLIESALNSDV